MNKGNALTGVALAVDVINHIIDHPEAWDQRHWHCGTSHCFFGHCQVRGGLRENSDSCFSDVVKLLGISESEASWLSASFRTLPQLHNFVTAMVAGRDRDGYDRDGRDRDGRDRDGYDRDGRDRDGYDRDGYDRDGRDRDGRDRDGRDRAGKPLDKIVLLASATQEPA